ncbi:TPA: hypothetical protein ACPZN3_002096, partial [Yersinia enterocolitica]
SEYSLCLDQLKQVNTQSGFLGILTEFFLQVLKIQFQVLALICFEMAAFIFNFLDTAQLIFFVPFYKLVMEVL